MTPPLFHRGTGVAENERCRAGRGYNPCPVRSLHLGRAAVISGALLAASLAFPSIASANDPKIEAEAKKLQNEAMDVYFLGLELKKAKTNLQQAVKKCGKEKCSKPLLASLYRDMGIVSINNGDTAEGEAAFDEAFKSDAAVEIGKDYLANGDVKKAWEAAKKRKGGTGGVTTNPTPNVEPDPTPSPDADGALTVKTKVAPAGSELPIYVEIPKGVEGVVSVKVQFKGDSMEKYKPLEAKKTGGKWLVIIPREATSKSGTLKFFAKAYDDAGAEVEHYGTIKKPATIKLVTTMPDDAEPPVLPGDKEPNLCGAEGSSSLKPEGSGCHEDDECEKGLVCIENTETGKKWCKTGDRVPKGDEPLKNTPKIWLGVEGQLDIVFLGAERNICKQTTWTCSYDGPDGRRDVGNAPGITLDPGNDKSGGRTDGGTALATKRAYVSFDYFIAPKFSLGARLGYAFGGNPTDQAKFMPFHGEVRLQYFITESTLRPYFLLGGGIAQFDAPVPNAVVTPSDPTISGITCLDQSTPSGAGLCADGSKPVLKNVTAYKLAGIGFLSAGLGTWIMVGNKFAINIGMKMIFPLPTFNFTLAPEVGLRFAL